MWWSPKSDAFHPPNEWNAIGTGIGTFTPTMPTSISCAKARAASPSRVKIATPLAYSCAEISSTASEKLFRRTIENRPEDLLLPDRHVGRHLVDQRAADIVAVLVALAVPLEGATIDHD